LNSFPSEGSNSDLSNIKKRDAMPLSTTGNEMRKVLLCLTKYHAIKLYGHTEV